MALVGFLFTGSAVHEEAYFSQVTVLQGLCQTSHLEVNVTKTKELLLQTKPSIMRNIHPVKLNGEPVEEVELFKYLGTAIDQTLTFNVNAENFLREQTSDCF